MGGFLSDTSLKQAKPATKFAKLCEGQAPKFILEPVALYGLVPGYILRAILPILL